MPNNIRLVLALHNHQPVGNFDHVFQQAFDDSYEPFLDVFERFESLKIALHTSGSLMEWLDQHQPRYVDRLGALAAEGRIEIISGAFFEPILAMIPSHDRIGQIRAYSAWLKDRLGVETRGMWVPERVWEQSFTRDIVDAGIEYTILDDFHFKCAGLGDDQLTGHLMTEDEGRVLSVFPGSERLRYLIPFGSPEETISHLAEFSEKHHNPVVIFGDDGEKFGTWPGTKDHVYRDGWLERFFTAIRDNQDWIQVTTPSEVIDNVAPAGKVFLPDCSYREMTEWALPVERQKDYEHLSHEFHDDPRWPALRSFMRGGFWRNFKVKYPEADEMYSRMMQISRRIQDAHLAVSAAEPVDASLLHEAQIELYRGQCNCSYWHGAFGGIYLPHLRNAVYARLIAADNLLDRAINRPEHWVEAVADDFNFDARQEVNLANDKLSAMIAPCRGGLLYELDVRDIEHNLLATFTRKSEVYHEKVLGGTSQADDNCASIHDRVVFKQEGLDERVGYDDYPRKSLVDLFYEEQPTAEAAAAVEARQIGDFVDGVYEARVRRNPDRIQVQLTRDGRVGDLPVRITKGLTLDAGSSALEIAYLLEGLPQDRALNFAVEMNFAGMPGGADDRFFRDGQGNQLGRLDTRLNLSDASALGLSDEWLGIHVDLRTSKPTGFRTFPVETVSQSEGGFELVHQSVAVQPHWQVVGDAEGRWSVTLQMAIDTNRAENHREDELATATG